MRGRFAAAAAVLLVLGSLTAGCGDRHGTGTPPQRAPRAGVEVRELVLPLDSFALQLPDLTRAQDAEDRLMRTCMARQHLVWTEIRRDPDGSPDRWPNRYRYGLIETKVARRFGYHPVPDPESDRRAAQYNARQASLSSRQRLAAYGRDDKGGCHAEAVKRLMAGVPRSDENLVDKISADTYRRSRTSTAVTDAVRAWNACIRHDGFSYAGPEAAADDRGWNTRTPTEPEIRTALADVVCKHRSGLVDVWRKTEAALQRRAIDAHAGAFRTLGEVKSRYLSNVRKSL
ncbi:hypothetical protein [Streptomyces collinus]|uniref:hypothetical protein n=1 Tax=Streptomyces collinus TaxID=42684 RepID=UPI002941C241|nr:hypothetical protein [Streptomyces collinus]